MADDRTGQYGDRKWTDSRKSSGWGRDNWWGLKSAWVAADMIFTPKVFLPVALAIGTLAGIQGASIVIDLASHPEPYSLSLQRLYYKDGKVWQQLQVSGGAESIPGKWVAEIDRGQTTLCRGAGPGLYNKAEYSEPKPFTPTEWTGDECPKIKSGDVGRVVYTYENVDGHRLSVTGTFQVE